MTIGSSLGRVVSTGNGSTTEYPFNAPVAADTEIKVYTLVIATGVQTLQTKGGSGTYDYTVTINSSTKYATITLGTALPDTHKIILLRNVPMTQDTDYVEGDAFGAETHESALDKLTTIATQISEVSDRSIKVQESSATSDIVCEELVADKILGVDSAGTGIEMKDNVTTVATGIEVADESTDTSCFPVFVTAATGTLPPLTGSNLAFNSSSGALTATSFVGDLTGDVTGTSSIATTVTVADESSDTTCFPVFVTAATGNLGPKSAAGLTFNSSTDVLSGTFSGNITGNVTGNTSGSSGSCTGTAAVATAVTITDNESTNEDNAIIFTSGGDVDGGNIGLESDGTLTYNPSTGKVTATGFIGALTGDASGSSGSCTGLAATATALASARTIGGVSFDGTGNINLPGVNTAGNQNTSGTAAIATAVTITDNESTNEDNAIIFTSGGDVDGGNIGLESDGTCTYNPSTGKITATGFIGALTGDVTGTASDATVLETARTIGGVSFNGSANINLPGVNATGDQNTSGTAAGLSATLGVGSGGTGATSLTANGVLIGNGTSAIASVDMSTKGKLLVGDGSGNPSLLTVGGTGGHVLQVDSSEATGMKWAAVSGGGSDGLVVESAVNFYGAGGSSVATYSYTGFDSDYDNYWVFIHGLSFDSDGGHLDFRFLDDGSAVTDGGYRVAATGQDSNGTARPIDENDTTSASLTSLGCNGTDGKPLSGWLYFPNGRGGRWDSDSTDSEGAVAPFMQFHLGYKNTSNYHEVVAGSVHQDNVSANAMNGFQLIGTSQNLRKVCLTVYGVSRA